MFSPLRSSPTSPRTRAFANRRALLFLERLEDRWAPALSYHGGPLLANVQVEAMYYSPWNTDATLQSQRSSLDSYFTSITGGSYMDLLAQYSAGGTTIGHGSLKADDAHFPTISLSFIDDTQIHVDLSQEINAGNNGFTLPNANTLYFVFTPPGVEVTAGGENSISFFAGYHSYYTDTTSGKTVAYAVIPYGDGSPNFHYNPLTNLQQLEDVSSHELAEAVTDPLVTGWYDSSLGGAGEIGDLANFSYATINGFVVQNEFSNAINGATPAQGSNFYISSFANPTEGTFNGVIATFVDTSGKGVLSAGQVNWGDGTYQNTTTIQQVNSTTFNLLASHTYSGDEGTSYNLNVWLTLADGSQAHADGALTLTDSFNVKHSYNDRGLVTLTDPPVVGTAATISATSGTAFTGTVATFTDPAGAETNDSTHYNATIDWGDGTPTTTGTIGLTNGVFTITGTHSYGSGGNRSVKVVINHEGQMTTVTSSATVTGSSGLVMTAPGAQTAIEGTAAVLSLGSFSDPTGSGSYSGTVDWGDGVTTPLTIGAAGSLGGQSHTYAEEGTFTITITVSKVGTNLSGSTTGQVTVSDAPVVFPTQLTYFVTTTGTTTNQVLTFTDPSGAELTPNISSHYVAFVYWGDNTSWSAGTITYSSGTFTVSGTHTYTASGGFLTLVLLIHDGATQVQVGFALAVVVPGGGAAVPGAASKPASPGDPQAQAVTARPPSVLPLLDTVAAGGETTPPVLATPSKLQSSAPSMAALGLLFEDANLVLLPEGSHQVWQIAQEDAR